MQQPKPSEETAALLARLSARPGVQSTLILSREDGAIVRSTGLITAEEIATEGGDTVSNDTFDNEGKTNKRGTRNAEEVAGLVWRFVKAAGEAAEEMNGESDEVKLLRLRTKRNELVIVPDKRFLLVVVHETPAA